MAALPNLLAVLALPIAGCIYDRYGGAANGLVMSHVLLMVVHGTLAFLIINGGDGGGTVLVMGLMLSMGVAIALGIGSVSPMLGFVMPHHSLATGYGLMYGLQNLGLALTPGIIAALQKRLSYVASWEVAAATPCIVLFNCTVLSFSATLCTFLAFKPTAAAAAAAAATIEEECDLVEGQNQENNVNNNSLNKRRFSRAQSLNAPLSFKY